MPVAYVHLSDIHFGQERGGDRITHDDVKRELIVDANKQVAEHFGDPATGIIVTGDTAYGGKAEEYTEAGIWLDKLTSSVGCSRTADLLHAETAALGPEAYLRAEYPMFAGRLEDTSELSVKVFGVSIVSGDFTDDKFKKSYFEKGLKKSGYVMVDGVTGSEMTSDLTLPVAWVLNV
jgi:hypothetical protein